MKKIVRTIEFSWEEKEKIAVSTQRNTSEIITSGSDSEPLAFDQPADETVDAAEDAAGSA